jgi:hypothetical protein
MELSIWYDECCSEVEAEVVDQDWMSFKKDVKDKSAKTTFGKTHRPEAGFANPVIRYGYEISCKIPFHLKEAQNFPSGSWSSAILCDYDPVGKANIMFEVDRGHGDYSCHTMRMSKFDKLISGNQITIKKI